MIGKENIEKAYACFSVSNSKEFLEKLYSGSFTMDEQNLLVDELVSNDMSVQDLVNVLANIILKENNMLN